MRRAKLLALLTTAALVLLAGLIAGCGKAQTPPAQTSTSGAEVDMTSNNFVQHAVTISAGQTVHFVDPTATGAFHQICLGNNQQCDTSGQGPAKLQSPGFAINPGQTVDVTFPTAGTYKITCTVHPDMNLTVTVN